MLEATSDDYSLMISNDRITCASSKISLPADDRV